MAPSRRRIELSVDPPCVYAIGDIHGCIEALRRLETKIFEDAQPTIGTKLLVYIGDFIDRGPDSAAVIDHLLSEPPAGFRRLCLAGNHEAMLFDLLEGRIGIGDWLQFGGDNTLFSYGFDFNYLTHEMRLGHEAVLEEFVTAFPPAHRQFLSALPVAFSTPRFLFTHAGVRPGTPLADQTDHDLMWVRDRFLNAGDHGLGKIVVHGHTPASQPVQTPFRIGIDTGAYMGGPLTAVRLLGEDVRFISVQS
nr:metallophosphoesterase family protein [Jiella avicenniae]